MLIDEKIFNFNHKVKWFKSLICIAKITVQSRQWKNLKHKKKPKKVKSVHIISELML